MCVAILPKNMSQVAFQENIQISLVDIMDLKIGWNGSKEEIALQEELKLDFPHDTIWHGITECHRLIWRWLITSGIF